MSEQGYADRVMAEEQAAQVKHGEGNQSMPVADAIARMETFEDYAAWQRHTYPPVEWLIDGVLSKDSVMLLVGPSSAGKSWLSLEWALCIAGGKSWNGHKTGQCEVAYLYFEGNRSKFQTRARKIADRHLIDNCGFHPIDGRIQKDHDGKRLHLTVGNLEPWIVENFKRQKWVGKVKLLIVDPLARLIQGYDENDNASGTKVAEVFESLAEQLGLAVLVIHHTRKNIEYGARPLDASRGNSAIVSALPDKLCLTIHPKNDGRNGTQKVGRLVGDGRDWDGPVDSEYVWDYGWVTRNTDDDDTRHVDFVQYWLENHLGESDSVTGRDLDSWQTMDMDGGKSTRSNVRNAALRNQVLFYMGKGAGLRWFLGGAGKEEFRKRRADSQDAKPNAPPSMGANELSQLVALFKTPDDHPSMADLEKRGKERGMTPAEIRSLVTLARDQAGQLRQIEGNPVTFALSGYAAEMKKAGSEDAGTKVPDEKRERSGDSCIPVNAPIAQVTL